MSAHTTFKIGGPADVFITVRDTDELCAAVKACRENGVPLMILGKGSNLLVSDAGIEGAVITLDGAFKELTVDGDTVMSGAGVALSKLCTTALENGLPAPTGERQRTSASRRPTLGPTVRSAFIRMPNWTFPTDTAYLRKTII